MSVVEYEVNGHVAVVTLTRPASRNAVNGEVASGLEGAVDRVETDSDVWCAVLAATGPVFSAGADLKVLAGGGSADLDTDRGGFAGIVRRKRSKPLVAAIEGPALAGGCEIALACDIVVASRAASFGLPEVKRSIIAGAGGAWRLARVIPRNLAMTMLLTGEPISGERAYELGFVSQLTEPGEALAASVELAQLICRNAPVAVRLSRSLLLDAISASDDDAWAMSRQALKAVMQTEDFREGPRAFIEKRDPIWSGH